MENGIGSILPNGWTVVDIVRAGGVGSEAVILATKAREYHPYAVWYANERDTGWDTYHGDYTNNLSEAVRYFDERVKRLG